MRGRGRWKDVIIIYLTPWWSWRPASPATRQRRSWSPPPVSWTCDVSWADYGSPGNDPGRWSTCALCSPNTLARRMSRTRCTTPRRTASILESFKEAQTFFATADLLFATRIERSSLSRPYYTTDIAVEVSRIDQSAGELLNLLNLSNPQPLA